MILLITVQLFFAHRVISECVSNVKHKFEGSWGSGNRFSHKGDIKPKFADGVKLRDWTLKIEFSRKLLGFQAWIAQQKEGGVGKKVITLQSMPWNQVITKNNFNFQYIADFDENTGSSHFVCAQLCGKVDGSNKVVCPSDGNDVLPPPKPPAPTVGPAITKAPATNPPINPGVATSAPVIPKPSCSPKYDYGDVLGKSLLFYEAQRSGKLPSTNRVPWRGDSALNDGSDNRIDLSGGYYDAGDHVKFGFPMASTITNLAWGMIAFKDGYKSSGQYDYGLEALKWATDYFIKCHPSKFVFYGQVGDGNADHSYWGRPEDMDMTRPSFKIDASKPGSDLAGETAAAMAACSLVFREAGNTGYADLVLSHAKDLFEFADSYRGKYSDSIPNAAGFYNSWSGYDDELAWASLWLYKATNNAAYRNKYMTQFDSRVASGSLGEFSWDNKWAGVAVLASELGISNRLGKLKSLLSQTNKFTRKGLFYVQKWGTTRHAANLAFLSLLASGLDQANKAFYQKFARGQIDYILGDGGRSYVVGFGKNPPKQPHHRSSSCPSKPSPCSWNNFNSPTANPQTLVGALVGGPDDQDNYADKRNDYIKNEVAMDYNAGFQSAIAGLTELAYKAKC